MSKLARHLSIIAAVFVIAGAGFTAKTLSEKKKNPKEDIQENEVLPEVKVMEVQNTNVATHLDLQGELVAFDKIDIFAEVSGVLKKNSKPFKVGSYFQKGAVLMEIEEEEARLALLSQKSSLLNVITQLMPDLKIDYPKSFQQWKHYLDEFDVENPIHNFPEPLNDQEKYFIGSRNLLTQFYNIKSAETRLKKYKIYAPFSGVVTQANTNPGALIQPGQKLGELMNTGNYELRATVPLSDLKFIKSGNIVTLLSNEISGEWEGRVRRVSDQIERGTQTATIFVSVNGKNLREGMYLLGKVNAAKIENAVSIPRNLIVNQNAVYYLDENILKLQPVEVVKITEDEAIVKGLANGQEILEEPVPGAFEGMKVIRKNL